MVPRFALIEYITQCLEALESQEKFHQNLKIGTGRLTNVSGRGGAIELHDLNYVARTLLQ